MTQVQPLADTTYRIKKKVKHLLIEQTIDNRNRKGLRVFVDGQMFLVIPHIEDNIDLSVVTLPYTERT